ncbi:hypothetical protein Cob_v002922 [Colletotrichum orbiculare MAFF 240422]|uniref:Selenoprotein domain-containing protein n=1 Tax=Colletotrichum orbiculare (strain 104-T / ATCC 96160 / CBS 514.97 / LARS 414 / MAFF 240422) TaxID=1213857 RepID=A0A484G0G1_COLOR|nr:hypothetical protein Cob_v002922 [Colletotrichum orbiculare MAFF 240422]
MTEATPAQPPASQPPFPLPRVAIQFCTQCKWMLRAAYFAQELLSTFSTSIGEVALQPSTGGTFTVTLTYVSPSSASSEPTTTILWDRKTEGGFPETKELKRRLRDVIQPDRDLGHVDRKHPKPNMSEQKQQQQQQERDPSSKDNADDAPPSVAAADVVSQLKKHPVNASKLSDDARAAVDAAHGNKGQDDHPDASPAGEGLGAKKKQIQQQRAAASSEAEDKVHCEDCA